MIISWVYCGCASRSPASTARSRQTNIFLLQHVHARILYLFQYHNHTPTYTHDEIPTSDETRDAGHGSIKNKKLSSWLRCEKCTYVYHIVFGIVRVGAADVQAASVLH